MKKSIKILSITLCALGFCFLFGSCKAKDQQMYNHYQMEIFYDDTAKSLTGKETVTYINQSDSVLDNLCFHLYPSAFRQGSKQSVVSLLNYTSCFYNGTSYGGITVDKVTVDVNDAKFSICGEDENILMVELPKKLSPQESIILHIEFSVTLPNANHRFGYGENTINIANFYPIACVFEDGEFMTKGYNCNGDPFYSQSANYDVTINYPSNLTIAHTGKLVEKQEYKNKIQNGHSYSEQDYTKSVITAQRVRDFAFVLSSKFKTAQASVDGTQITYFFYNDENFEKSLQTAVDSVKTFNKLFGKYAYDTLAVAKTNFVHGGMEYPNLVYIADSLDNYTDYQNVIVHEIAHQWWYNMVGSNAFDNGWQDEGLTDYSTAIFYEHNPQYNRSKDNIILNGIRNYAFFTDVYSSVYGKLDTSMTRALDEYPTDPEYVYIAYVKSMLMFDSLRAFMGDKDFFEGARDYFQTYCFKIASPQDMIACFQKHSKKDVEAFFDSWLGGKVLIISAS